MTDKWAIDKKFPSIFPKLCSTGTVCAEVLGGGRIKSFTKGCGAHHNHRYNQEDNWKQAHYFFSFEDQQINQHTTQKNHCPIP